MSIEAMQIKQRMGDNARDRIISDLGLKRKGDHVCCPSPSHQDNSPSAHWHREAHQFHCFGCGESYDIFNHFEYHHGMNFFEALQVLGKELGIKINSSAPLLTKRIKLENSEIFNTMVSKRPLSKDSAQDYLRSKKIDFNVFTEVFGGKSSEREIFFSHYENIEGIKTEIFCKRRKLDGSTHKNIEGEEMGKEISLKGGISSFYGLNPILEGKDPQYCIITEGHTDALRVATELYLLDQLDEFLVLSLPNGARSLKVAIENSPSFNKYQRKIEKFIIIPDADEAGQGFISDCAKYLDHVRTTWINIADFGGIQYQKNKGQDISDLLDLGININVILSNPSELPNEFCKQAKDVARAKLNIGFSSGFKTFDYSESGVKEGKLTLLTGFRGQGKTTFARQVLIASAKQGYKSLAWFGESNIEEENDIFALISANGAKVDVMDNGHGRSVFTPNDEAVEDFKQDLGNKISFYVKPNEYTGNLFDHMMQVLKEQAKKGVKLFLIDNLMVLTGGAGSAVFSEQERIVLGLKAFAVKFKVHVMLVAHPKKGEGHQAISGSASIENTADSIYRYVRVNEGTIKAYIGNVSTLDSAEHYNISAVVLNEKVRDNGVENTMFLEWVPERGCVREICYIPEIMESAKEFEELGLFSRPSRTCEARGGITVNGLVPR